MVHRASAKEIKEGKGCVRETAWHSHGALDHSVSAVEALCILDLVGYAGCK